MHESPTGRRAEDLPDVGAAVMTTWTLYPSASRSQRIALDMS